MPPRQSLFDARLRRAQPVGRGIDLLGRDPAEIEADPERMARGRGVERAGGGELGTPTDTFLGTQALRRSARAPQPLEADIIGMMQRTEPAGSPRSSRSGDARQQQAGVGHEPPAAGRHRCRSCGGNGSGSRSHGRPRQRRQESSSASRISATATRVTTPPTSGTIAHAEDLVVEEAVRAGDRGEDVERQEVRGSRPAARRSG